MSRSSLQSYPTPRWLSRPPALEVVFLRDILRLPALRQAQDGRRGFAPLHTPSFISLLVRPHRQSAPVDAPA